MKKLREGQNGPERHRFEEAGQGTNCSNAGFCQHPLLNYNQATSLDSEYKTNVAFDILFQEVMQMNKLKNHHEISRHIRPGFDRATRRGTNH
jgi:hypothetical protein